MPPHSLLIAISSAQEEKEEYDLTEFSNVSLRAEKLKESEPKKKLRTFDAAPE